MRRLTPAVCLVPLILATLASLASAADAPLPDGVAAVWDLAPAYRVTTPTRERISINGLWRWQPARQTDKVPEDGWGYFKVPGCWPGITDYMQHDSQTVYPHPSWNDMRLGEISAAWYQREITVPPEWNGRRITLAVEYLNSSAEVFVDGRPVGETQFPAGEVELTAHCRAGAKHVLSLLVTARPLQEIMLSFSNTNTARATGGRVERRGLCGDVYLTSAPSAARIGGVKIDTSVRKGEITIAADVAGLAPAARYTLRAAITAEGRTLREFTSRPIAADDLQDGRIVLSEKWKPEKLWDIHTPQNMLTASVSLLDERGAVLDGAHPVRFGFREFWIDGRDFYLNGSRIYLSALPVDNAQVSAAAAGYAGAKETFERLKRIGINFVYTHNYGCEPGSHLSFTEILRAADDVGILVALSQPHFGQYDWSMPEAQARNGYAAHARFYVDVAGNHPSVVFYSMSHNSTGYDEDMNPDRIDGLDHQRDQWAQRNVDRALQAEAIVARLDPGRIVYHHSSGSLSSMHTSNFYTNMAPAQELDDWFEHWATTGIKPMFTCEYMVPCTWDWTMYRGWYKGKREFGSAAVPWEFCVAEWSAQFSGDRAYEITEPERKNLRWEAEQFSRGRLWHRWDYPTQVGSPVFDVQHEIIGKYLANNWRAFRTWGVSAISPWEYHFFWKLRDGVDKSRQQLPVDWQHLQRPGFSPDYLGPQYERVDMAYEFDDWIATADGQAILRNNQPLLAYIAGKPAAFTSKDHIFTAGETFEKQLILINNSRETVTAECRWKLALPEPLAGGAPSTVATGQQQRLPLRFTLPPTLAPDKYELTAEVRFSTGEVQRDTITIHVLPPPARSAIAARIALFDPGGETAALLKTLAIEAQPVDAADDLSGFDLLIVGKQALTLAGAGPDLRRVRDGLKVLVFEQTDEVLEQRLGFRVAAYGLRQVFARAPDHPALAGIAAEHLNDWRGAATLLPPRLEYRKSRTFGGPAVDWCGIEVPHVWRCGNRGNVASVLIEKPARGDFLPILEGGYSLQYSPLLEYREGRGMVVFCQLDVTGRTAQDPAAETLARNLLDYVTAWKPAPRRQALYAGDPAGRRHLEYSGIPVRPYTGGSLSAETVLVVGPGGGRELSNSAPAIADFLRVGGHVLTLGLDGTEAAAFLPFKVETKNAEHIATWFPPPGRESLLVGIGPADIHNRAPRGMPLITTGADVIGDGVLAEARPAHVVFCQFPPHTVSKAEGAVPSFVVNGDDEQYSLRRTYRRASFQLARILANMGVAASTPLLDRFSSSVDASAAEKRWLGAYYLDKPIEWDDPYRFFRW